MSLFSFFRRDKTAQDNNRTTERNTRPDTEKQGRRGRSAAPAEADPQLPEKQRARRRLIGSIVLVVAALIVLPLVFESKPQKPNLNIALQVDSNASPSAPAPQPEAQPAQTAEGTQPAGLQPVPENAGAAAQEQATDAAQPPAQAPVSEPMREAVPDRNAEQARVDKERETKADRERAEKERKAKAEREKADREREAKAKADREKADRERAEKERKAKAERDRAERKASKEKRAKKKTAGGDPIGQMIANKTKRR